MQSNIMPYKLLLTDGENVKIEWIDVQNERFTEPFWAETITKCKFHNSMQENEAEKHLTDLQTCITEAEKVEFIAPTAFIFHISRCGSTLISQLLSMLEQNIVLAEPDIVDDILCLPYTFPTFSEEQKIAAIQAILRLWGKKRSDKEQNLFIKTDSWHLFFYEILRKIYPNVPIVLLYRFPLEVIHSQQKKRGMQSIQGLKNPAILGLEIDEITGLSLDEYMGLVLTKFFQKMKEIAETDNNCLLVNYKEGMMPIMERFATFTSQTFTEEEKESMKNRTQFNAKYPQEKFAEKMPEADIPEYLTEAVELYEYLEQLREKQK